MQFVPEEVGLCLLLHFECERMQLVYEIILLNMILRNHLLSENLQWNYGSFNVYPYYLIITEFCVTSSLAPDNWGQKHCQTLGNKPNLAIPIFFDRFTYKFLKNRPGLGKTYKKYHNLKVYKFIFSEQKIILWEDTWQWIVFTMKKGNDWYLWSGGKTFTLCDARTIIIIIFPKGKFKLFNSLFHSAYLVFSIHLISIADLFTLRYLWDVCNEDKCCVVTHLRQTF